MTELEIAQLAAKAAEDKKAHNVVILDLKGLSIIADYFVVCHGNSETQVQAIVDHIKDSAEKAGIVVRGREGYDDARWVLVDLGDVVVHVFHRDEREFYNIERLWKDAPVVAVQ
ncbi:MULTISPECIES: ribosome silencing factor [Aneurinibacillus]|uniref:Ribosomal silencing factor RsfS n=1 Tax=Aneurinibacillus thermoaerophilus TaxID=143495 RepID=A0A1G7Z8A8_ANETH|nr:MULTISPECIES: ribosome silencing factor [Aneurinibacillus]AMA72305.1 ribosomal silencing factor RsfS [Aneurinibacillus sp. XH2]MED0674844.1 ribosome silencing factor [Aneurinibacillus thermoaerophilus]MED0679794.1 ribosome silencing factor [Aneurinibacillus thermoaerophilus]MED0735826.1 ribosome silencing factor [Aneurinibacillus thermoaerophilus]MED0758504.1 ribosome silencing factor [Aneurinibacillus thermoaerophilus]